MSGAGIAYRYDGTVLMLCRSDDYTFNFTGGGCELGESPEDCARRESLEEAGYKPEGPLRLVRFDNDFSLYLCDLDAPFVPVLNDEHVGYVWVPLSAAGLLPMRPDVADCLGCLAECVTAAQDKAEVDVNGWYELPDTPISKVGIYPYSGASLGLTGEDATRMFNVLRPEEELSKPECIESFKLIPWVDDHTMLGPTWQSLTPAAMPAEVKGVAGVTGERVYYKEGALYANLKLFSEEQLRRAQDGKIQLSAAYMCKYDRVAGDGYDFIQRDIRGNHVASVNVGRMGPDVSITFDEADTTMADTPAPTPAPTEAPAPAPTGADAPAPAAPVAEAPKVTLEDLMSSMGALVPLLTKLSDIVGAMGNKPAVQPEADGCAPSPMMDAAEQLPPARVAQDAAPADSFLTKFLKGE